MGTVSGREAGRPCAKPAAPILTREAAPFVPSSFASLQIKSLPLRRVIGSGLRWGSPDEARQPGLRCVRAAVFSFSLLPSKAKRSLPSSRLGLCLGSQSSVTKASVCGQVCCPEAFIQQSGCGPDTGLPSSLRFSPGWAPRASGSPLGPGGFLLSLVWEFVPILLPRLVQRA